jgi:hypothetical protein
MKASPLLLVPVLLVAACGGGASSLSKTAYLAKAEAICTKANADVKAVTSPTTAAAVLGYIGQLIDIADKATKDLDALEPPSADKADLEKKVLTPLHKQLSEGKDFQKKIKAAVDAHDQTALGQLLANPPTQTQADLAFMTSYGFKACVESAKTNN